MYEIELNDYIRLMFHIYLLNLGMMQVEAVRAPGRE